MIRELTMLIKILQFSINQLHLQLAVAIANYLEVVFHSSSELYVICGFKSRQATTNTNRLTVVLTPKLPNIVSKLDSHLTDLNLSTGHCVTATTVLSLLADCSNLRRLTAPRLAFTEADLQLLTELPISLNYLDLSQSTVRSCDNHEYNYSFQCELFERLVNLLLLNVANWHCCNDIDKETGHGFLSPHGLASLPAGLNELYLGALSGKNSFDLSSLAYLKQLKIVQVYCFDQPTYTENFALAAFIQNLHVISHEMADETPKGTRESHCLVTERHLFPPILKAPHAEMDY